MVRCPVVPRVPNAAFVGRTPHGSRGDHGRIRPRRPLALGGVVATGMLTGSMTGMPQAHAAQTLASELPTGSPAGWDAHRAVNGELAGLASSAPALLDLVGAGDDANGSMLKTVELVERVAWTRQVAAGTPIASMEATVLRGRHRSASEQVIATRSAGRLTGRNAHAAGWRHQERVEEEVTLEALAVAEAQAAAQAEAERVAAEQARIEAERVAAEAAAAAAAAQAEAERVAAEQGRIESERIAAEQAQAAEAQRYEQEAAQEQQAAAPAAAPVAAPAPTPPAPAPAPAVPVAAPAPSNNTEALENQAFALVNQERARVGLPALSFDASLRESGRAQAARIAAARGLFHQDLQPLLGQGWRTAGENVGGGPSIELLHPAFVASPGHYANIVNPSFAAMGVGVVVSADGTVWISSVFGG